MSTIREWFFWLSIVVVAAIVMRIGFSFLPPITVSIDVDVGQEQQQTSCKVQELKI